MGARWKCYRCGKFHTSDDVEGQLRCAEESIANLKSELEDAHEHLRLLNQYPEDLESLRNAQAGGGDE